MQENQHIRPSGESPRLIDEFELDRLIVVGQNDAGASDFQRLDEPDYKRRLEDYTTGELGEKNVLGGNPYP